MRTLLPVAAAGTALLLVACGQKGPLVLPDRDASGVVIRAPASAPAAQASPAPSSSVPAPAPTSPPTTAPPAPPVTPGTDTAATPAGTGAPTTPGSAPRYPDPSERRP